MQRNIRALRLGGGLSPKVTSAVDGDIANQSNTVNLCHADVTGLSTLFPGSGNLNLCRKQICPIITRGGSTSFLSHIREFVCDGDRNQMMRVRNIVVHMFISHLPPSSLPRNSRLELANVSILTKVFSFVLPG